jgi:hypothetical protein
MTAASAMIDAGNIIDAEFETVVPAVAPELRASTKARPILATGTSETLSILRGADPEGARGGQPDQLTPSFLLFTAIAAFAVFWVCGGRFLLY